MFSEQIIKYWNAKDLHDALQKIRAAKKDYDRWVWTFLRNHHIVVDSVLTKDDCFTNSKYIQECITNPYLIDVIIWINLNIVSTIDTDTYKTTEVKLRIATCKLYKLAKESKLHEDFALTAYTIMLSNVHELKSLLVDEELPFLQG